VRHEPDHVSVCPPRKELQPGGGDERSVDKLGDAVGCIGSRELGGEPSRQLVLPPPGPVPLQNSPQVL
jgi:hypothetical protein